MNKGALGAVIMALLIPLVSYFIVKTKSAEVSTMPPHYYADTVIEKIVNGKKTTDTIWHQLANFSLTNQQGKKINFENLKGKIIVADFFFTHCPTICPPMTKNMKRLQESINNGQRVGDKTNKLIHFLSFSIDSERDSVERLKYWADRFQINPEKWWLLTGDKKKIYDFALNEVKLGVQDGEGIDTNFVHSSKFVLIDSSRYVRGFYDGLDSISLARLSEDIVKLTMEKNKKAKSFFSGKLEIMAIAFLSAIFGVGLLIFLIKRKK